MSGEEEWVSTLKDVMVEPFNQLTGPSVPVSANPREMLSSLFTPQLIDHIVVETSRYAVACLTSAHTGEGPVPEWNTNAEEIHGYLGFSIFMGVKDRLY